MRNLKDAILKIVIITLIIGCNSNDQMRSKENNDLRVTSNPNLEELYELAVAQAYKINDNEISSDSIFSIAKKLQEDAEQNGNEYNLVRARVLASRHYYREWKWDTCKFLIDQNLAYFNENPSENYNIDRGRTLHTLVWLSIGNQDYGQAKIQANELYTIYENSGFERYRINSLSLLASIDFLLSNYPEAFEKEMQAQNALDDLGIPPEEQNNFYNLSLYLNKIGEYDKQREYALLSLSIAEKKQEFGQQMLVYNSLGNLYSEKFNKLDSALIYFNKSKDLARSNNNFHRYYLAEMNTLIMYTNNENYETGIKLANSMINGGDEVPAWAKTDAKAYLAKCYLYKGLIAKAIVMGTKALSTSIEQGNKEEIIDRLETVTEAFKRNNQYDSAYRYLEMLHVYKDSLYNDQSQRKLSSLYADLETNDKQREIDKLRMEKQLVNVKAKNLRNLFWASLLISLLIVMLLLAFLRIRQKLHLLQKYELQSEIERKIQDLNQQSVRLIQKSNSMLDVEEGLIKVKKGLVNGKAQEVQTLLNTIRVNKIVDKEWNKFDEYFGAINKSFLEKLSLKFPELTVTELRLSSLIKMGFTNREISEIMNIEDKSVRMAKYRLKKKLRLEEGAKMREFIAKIESNE